MEARLAPLVPFQKGAGGGCMGMELELEGVCGWLLYEEGRNVREGAINTPPVHNQHNRVLHGMCVCEQSVYVCMHVCVCM